MANPATTAECPTHLLMQAVEMLGADDERGLQQIDQLLRDYDGDARLHFLRGSVLAGLRRYDEAHVSMGRALEVAPGYALARFQLGFLQLTSGDFPSAQATWAPLLVLDADEPLKIFAQGLSHIACDEFAAGIELLNHGIAANTENAPINADMRLIIETTQRTMAENAAITDDAEPLSPTQMLLQQYAAKTKH